MELYLRPGREDQFAKVVRAEQFNPARKSWGLETAPSVFQQWNHRGVYWTHHGTRHGCSHLEWVVGRANENRETLHRPQLARRTKRFTKRNYRSLVRKNSPAWTEDLWQEGSHEDRPEDFSRRTSHLPIWEVEEQKFWRDNSNSSLADSSRPHTKPGSNNTHHHQTDQTPTLLAQLQAGGWC